MPPSPASPILASTKKLNAIKPNPIAVSENASTSGIKFTFTSLSSSLFDNPRAGEKDDIDTFCNGKKPVSFVSAKLKWTFLAVEGLTKAAPYVRDANIRLDKRRDLIVNGCLRCAFSCRSLLLILILYCALLPLSPPAMWVDGVVRVG
eukprot:CAMPEP_0172556908 /NCGR_PEP_ID=MMETSP1067-20121228/70034_1 /TAXON_ID=265564 ORGANISM="Thalassiosira punctigera, Strain Tpunct2005C2" /NCGR_SAMPLE_ID=MMETSP1067 /ASSEMBLY_ACC=CAM_ASM_000444 /LENGTH=147 /DNA_ID=CAMNT_0013345843 /DNA_START=721 /DNA_END=1160 /DNA_ORIENTATION=-